MRIAMYFTVISNTFIRNVLLFLWCFFGLSLTNLYGQHPKIRLGNTEISIDDMFEISVTLSEPIEKYKGFPQISGFVQYEKKRDEQIAVVNGKALRMSTFTVMYRPLAIGTYQVPSFTITVNDKSIKQKGFSIKVKKEGKLQDPMLSNFFGEPIDFEEVKADVFFDITTDRTEVFVGEGFNVVMAIYVKREDVDNIDFPNDLDRQIGSLLKKIKPKNCWEENFEILHPIDKQVVINGKTYWQYKVFQANFYPLDATKIEIPSVPLEIIKIRMAKISSAITPIVDRMRKTYYSKSKTIIVKPLPPHSLSAEVSVGQYEIEERVQFSDKNIPSRTTETGKNFAYVLRIKGEGNISAIRAPQLISDDNFEFYPSSIIGERIERNQNSVYGYRDFRYNIIPKKPAKYDLGNYVRWVYFNTKMQTYDTLKSTIQFEAIGDEVEIYQADSLQTGLYADLQPDNSLINMNGTNYTDIFTNLSLLLLLGTTAFLTFKK